MPLCLTPTPFAKTLLEYDNRLDRTETLWILHHTLVSNPDVATTWHWYFTLSGLSSFTKQQFLDELMKFIEKNTKNRSYALRSLESDFNVLTRMYLSTGDTDEKDSIVYPSPFAVLDLLSFNPYQKRFLRNLTPKVTIEIFLYTLYLYKEKYFPDTSILDLDLAKENPHSPFRTFGYSVSRFSEEFDSLKSNIKKKLTYSRTAGIHTLSWKQLLENELLDEVYSGSVKGSLLVS